MGKYNWKPEKAGGALGALALVLFGLIVFFVSSSLNRGGRGDGDSREGAVPADFSYAVEKVLPSLVKIENEGLGGHPDIGGSGKQVEIARTSEGSGFFIDSEGRILTNYHVVEGAQTITVITREKKRYNAELIGADILTDIALLKIKPDFDVTPVSMGDSSRLKVGQWVIAIGNPLGLDFFTSAGIVSGFGPPGPNYIGFYDFIQADLNIEPGNSGGPLLNSEGQVVGINNAYLGPGTNIGFSIPINRAKEVVDQLLEKGSISRGFLGVLGQPLTQGLADRLGLKEVKGAMVTEVLDGSPAQLGGIRKQDVIIEFNGQPVDNDRELQAKVYETPANTRVNFHVVRDGKKKVMPVTLGELKEHSIISEQAVRQCGISFARMTDALAQRLGLNDSNGLLVLRVIPGCPAFEGGLRFGDVLLEVEGNKVYNEADFYRLYSRLTPGKQMMLKVFRDGRPIYLTIKQGE